MIKKELSFWKLHDKINFIPYRFFGISFIANKFPSFYERFLTFLFPGKEIKIIIEIEK